MNTRYFYEKYSVSNNTVYNQVQRNYNSGTSYNGVGNAYGSFTISNGQYVLSDGPRSVSVATSGTRAYTAVIDATGSYPNGTNTGKFLKTWYTDRQYVHELVPVSSEVKGTFIETVVGESTSYPLNGKHTDGFWYVRGDLVQNRYLLKDGAEIKKYSGVMARVKPIALHAVGKTEFIKWDPTYTSANSEEALKKVNGEISVNLRVASKFDHKIPYVLEFDSEYSLASLTGLSLYTIQGSNDNVNFKSISLPSSTPYRFYKFTVDSAGSVSDYPYTRALDEQYFECERIGWSIVEAESLTSELFGLHGMSDLSLINDEAMQQLNSDQIELLCWTDEVTLSRQVGITGLPPHALLAGEGDFIIKEAEKITLSANKAMGAVIRIIVSSDEGLTWKGKSTLTLNDLPSVKSNGFTSEEFNALTKEQIATLFPNGTARFAFYIEQENISDVVEIQSLSVGEKQYTISPTATDLSLIYEVLREEKPTLYGSRDDGVSWKEISQDEMASLSEQPEGKNLRIKAVLKNGKEIHAMSYAWS